VALGDTSEAKVHRWRIDPKQYARQESRRGRRHAYESFDPARTVLVVVDMVPFFANENPYCRGIVHNISALADSLRNAGGVVAWVLPASTFPTPVDVELFGPDIAKMFSRSGGEGPLVERLWHEFRVDELDIMVEKSASSAFFPGRCDLPALLEKRLINTVLITGTVTNVCCESSARDASTLGYRVVMVADANATVDDEMHNATLKSIYRTFGDVRSTEELLWMIDEGVK